MGSVILEDLGDMLRLLPGVIVRKNHISMYGMADLDRIKLNLLERLLKSTIEALRPSATYFPSYFEMGKYAELSSEGECDLCTVVSLF